MSFGDLERGQHFPPSLGANPDSDFDRKCSEIERNIYSIQSHVNTISKLSTSLNTNKDNHALREQIHKANDAASQLSRKVNDSLKALSPLLVDQRRKTRHSSLKKAFESNLRRYQEIQKSAIEKMKQSVVVAKAAVAEHHHHDEAEDQQSLMQYDKQRQLAGELDHDIEYNDMLIAEREEGIRDIQQAIVDVNEIFRDLGTIVASQQGLIDNIESNIGNTVSRTEDASRELTQANRSQKSYRKKLCCFAAFAVLVAVVIIIMVLTIR